ncbi:MAG: archease [Halodesulfurarchaeum sp.]
MSYRLREHTADVAVEATAESLGGVFGAAADGMAAAMADEIPDDVGARFELSLEAESREALLFDYLDRLIYERDVREVLPVDNRAEVRAEEDRFTVEASARGIPFDEVDGRDLKAVTYSEMVLEHRGGEWYAYVVFDV